MNEQTIPLNADRPHDKRFLSLLAIFVLFLAGTTGALVREHSSLVRRLEVLQHDLDNAKGVIEGVTSDMHGFRRKLLATTASADTLEHTSSDGTTPLTVSSNVAVNVESVRFDGTNIGVSGDIDLMTLSANLLTVNGHVKSTPVGCYGTPAGATFTSSGSWVTINSLSFTGNLGGWNSGACTSAGVFTAPADGYYYASATVRVDKVNSGFVRLIISVNDSPFGSDYGYEHASQAGHVIGAYAGDYHSYQVNNIVKISSGDTIRFKLWCQNDNSWSYMTQSHVVVYMLTHA